MGVYIVLERGEKKHVLPWVSYFCLPD